LPEIFQGIEGIGVVARQDKYE